MDKIKCPKCGEYRRCRDGSAALIFFIIGLVATVAIRAVTILEHIDPGFGKAAWYIGVLGFVVFFVYKFRVDHSRSAIIRHSGIMKRLSGGDGMSGTDREFIKSILCSLSSTKDRINYLVLFLSSAVALGVAVYLDFIKR